MYILEDKNYFKNFKLSYIYNNNYMDGNRLRIYDIDKIINEKIIDEQLYLQDVYETRNMNDLLDYIFNEKKELNIEEIEKYYSILITDIDLDTHISKEDKKEKLNTLIEKFKNNIKNISDIIDFHFKFEEINFFEKYNNKIGRIIMLKQSLDNNIEPFIIPVSEKEKYDNLLENKNKLELINWIEELQKLEEKIVVAYKKDR